MLSADMKTGPMQYDFSIIPQLIYRSRMLHAGSVDPACGLPDDPRTGRLTANAFFFVSAPR